MTRTVLFTGSRHYARWQLVHETLINEYTGSSKELRVVFGDCPSGLDLIVRMWVSAVFETTGFPDFHEYEADWNRFGDAAGPIRNHWMVDKEQPDIVYAFPDGKSTGTLDCATYAYGQGIQVVFPEMLEFAARYGEDGRKQKQKTGGLVVAQPRWFNWAKTLI